MNDDPACTFERYSRHDHPLGWQRKDWFSKLFQLVQSSLLGARASILLCRGGVDDSNAELKQQGVEHMLFSGDATALGFEAELCRAAELLEVKQRPGLAVPGNHDYITRKVARSGLFERVFAPWQTGQRPTASTLSNLRRRTPSPSASAGMGNGHEFRRG